MPPPPGIARAPFPARTTTATQDVGDIPTTITATRFSDKLLVTISQDGRLAIWTALPLTPPLSTTRSSGASSTLLPAAHLTPSPLLGHTHEARSTLAQLLATQVGHILIERGGAGGPSDGPGGLPGAGGGGAGGMLVMGVGLRNETVDRDEFAALVGGVLDCVG